VVKHCFALLLFGSVYRRWRDVHAARLTYVVFLLPPTPSPIIPSVMIAMSRFLVAAGFWLSAGVATFAADKPRNILFILSDDHRWDFMSFMPEAPKFLET